MEFGLCERIIENISRVIVGKDQAIELLLVGLMAEGHVLLECMEERQVTVDGKTHPLPAPFLVMATQNPIELEGTFPLPEAQLDRFILKTQLGYPDKKEEVRILERFQETDPFPLLEPVATPEDITGLQKARRDVRVSQPIREYITDIVRATRDDEAIQFGASPRASLESKRTASSAPGKDF